MKRAGLVASCAIFLLVCFTVSSAYAEPIAVADAGRYIRFHSEGLLTSTTENDGSHAFADAFPFGSPFSLDATIDTSDPGFISSNGTRRYNDALVGLTLDLNGLIYDMTSGFSSFAGMTYSDTGFNTGLASANFTGPPVQGSLPGYEFLIAVGPQQSNSIRLLWFAPPETHGGVVAWVDGVVKSTRQVPEPTSFLSVLAGATAMLLQARTKRRRPNL